MGQGAESWIVNNLRRFQARKYVAPAGVRLPVIPALAIEEFPANPAFAIEDVGQGLASNVANDLPIPPVGWACTRCDRKQKEYYYPVDNNGNNIGQNTWTPPDGTIGLESGSALQENAAPNPVREEVSPGGWGSHLNV